MQDHHDAAKFYCRFLRIKAVLQRTGLSRSTLYRRIEAGTFPKQVQIGIRCAAWRESEIDAWMRNPMFYSDELGM